MTGNDQAKGRPEGGGAPDEPGQPRVSRRSLLGAAGIGAAGIAAGAFGGLAAAGPALAATRREPAKQEPARTEEHHQAAQPAAKEPVVVHVRDPRTGELDVYSGTSHTRVHDPDLAARLSRTIE
ncbi:MAG TPA: hypothetical protein VGL63_05400 [Streptosporangiaceae bacterium]|jgi:anti-sigma factor RsiW